MGDVGVVCIDDEVTCLEHVVVIVAVTGSRTAGAITMCGAWHVATGTGDVVDGAGEDETGACA